MKIFALFSMVLLITYVLGLLGKETTPAWMSRHFTSAIKGFSIFTIVWAHTGAQLNVGGIQFVAGIGVSLFLICSGYGLELSYQKNGLKNFVKRD
ncbi:MAG: hypothetical protein Q4B26_19625 [Eubacteriales bacterium]|nr:hypothetical protein [Eubacteriales bacterium]